MERIEHFCDRCGCKLEEHKRILRFSQKDWVVRVYIFIKSWLYYPKLIKYLQKTQPYMAKCIKKLGRIKYAKFLSAPKKNTDYADNISDFISEWVTAYDIEPIEK